MLLVNLPAILFVIYRCSFYGALAVGFSMFGIIMPGAFVIGNPLEVSNPSMEYVLGHIIWGLAIGAVILSVRYIVLSGLFPIILDSDHPLQFLDIAFLPRLAHSVFFGIITALILMIIFGKKILEAIGIAAVYSYISFDIFLSGGSKFPLFSYRFLSQIFI